MILKLPHGPQSRRRERVPTSCPSISAPIPRYSHTFTQASLCVHTLEHTHNVFKRCIQSNSRISIKRKSAETELLGISILHFLNFYILEGKIPETTLQTENSNTKKHTVSHRNTSQNANWIANVDKRVRVPTPLPMSCGTAAKPWQSEQYAAPLWLTPDSGVLLFVQHTFIRRYLS